jgi:hypothetical protein
MARVIRGRVVGVHMEGDGASGNNVALDIVREYTKSGMQWMLKMEKPGSTEMTLEPSD